MMLLILALVGIAIGLGAVWRAAERVIVHALRLARHYNVSTFFVGFVFLAIAANLPELAVAIVAGIQGFGQLAAGDIIGACFSDVALVTGAMLLLVGSVAMKQREAMSFLWLILGAGVVMGLVFWLGRLHSTHGWLLVLIYAAFLFWAWRHRHEHTLLEVVHDDLDHPKALNGKGLFIVWAKTVGALSIVLAGSGIAIRCGVYLTQLYGLSLETVGATIIALGTSLPEISLGIHAYKKRQYALALGPTIGTVFSQSTCVLGVLAVLSQEPIQLASLQAAAGFMFVAFAVIALSIVFNKTGRLTGITLLGLFFMYMLYHVAPF